MPSAPGSARTDRRLDWRLARRGGALELLRVPSALFAGLARLRAVGYERGWLPSTRVGVPVVSVGNVTAGGTGKTPCVAFVARELVSALGNPEAFQRTVEGLGARVVRHRVFADHHAYSAADLEEASAPGRWLVTSEKDAVKLAGWRRCHVLGVEFELREGAPVLAALLDGLQPGEALRARRALHEGLHG